MVLNEKTWEEMLNEKIVVDERHPNNTFSFAKYFYKRRSEPFLVSIMNKQALHGNVITRHQPFNPDNNFDRKINELVLKMINDESVRINYLVQTENENHSPLSYAINYQFPDVVKAILRRPDIDPNFKYYKYDRGFKQHRMVNPVYAIQNSDYSKIMMTSGTYKEIFTHPKLSLAENEWFSLYIWFACQRHYREMTDDELDNLIEIFDIIASHCKEKKYQIEEEIVLIKERKLIGSSN